MWPFSKKKTEAAPAAAPRLSPYENSTAPRAPKETLALIAAANANIAKQPYQPPAIAMDGIDGACGYEAPEVLQHGVPLSVLGWYAGQSFIGYSMCAIIAQHWLVDKACTMPARDAVRQGFSLLTYTDAPGDEDPDEDLQGKIEETIRREDRKHDLMHQMTEFVRLGRVFGIRIALFRIKGATPDFYANPFNIDGVGEGDYLGISQIDPQWCAPLLSEAGASDPASAHFYEPEWWLIRGVKYHRSHLVIFRNGELPDILKPSYMYGGISVPQRIYERVYAAERTANEAPQLALAKRSMYLKTDLAILLADPESAKNTLGQMAQYQDNYSIRVIDTDDEYGQHDVSLADFDTVVMTQYQIVSAASNVPATKLLGTTPKGFNATGEHETQSYHEELETIQAHDLTRLVNRHHELVMRSVVEPEFTLSPSEYRVEIEWNPVDSPTAKEQAEINKLEADTDNVLVQTGAIDATDIRNRIRGTPSSGYSDLAKLEDDGDLGGLGL